MRGDRTSVPSHLLHLLGFNPRPAVIMRGDAVRCQGSEADATLFQSAPRSDYAGRHAEGADKAFTTQVEYKSAPRVIMRGDEAMQYCWAYIQAWRFNPRPAVIMRGNCNGDPQRSGTTPRMFQSAPRSDYAGRRYHH